MPPTQLLLLLGKDAKAGTPGPLTAPATTPRLPPGAYGVGAQCFQGLKATVLVGGFDLQ